MNSLCFTQGKSHGNTWHFSASISSMCPELLIFVKKKKKRSQTSMYLHHLHTAKLYLMSNQTYDCHYENSFTVHFKNVSKYREKVIINCSTDENWYLCINCFSFISINSLICRCAFWVTLKYSCNSTQVNLKTKYVKTWIRNAYYRITREYMVQIYP